MGADAIERTMSYLLRAVPLVTRYNPDGLPAVREGLAALADMLDDQLRAD